MVVFRINNDNILLLIFETKNRKSYNSSAELLLLVAICLLFGGRFRARAGESSTQTESPCWHVNVGQILTGQVDSSSSQRSRLLCCRCCVVVTGKKVEVPFQLITPTGHIHLLSSRRFFCRFVILNSSYLAPGSVQTPRCPSEVCTQLLENTGRKRRMHPIGSNIKNNKGKRSRRESSIPIPYRARDIPLSPFRAPI
jgi:hypothetical protein